MNRSRLFHTMITTTTVVLMSSMYSSRTYACLIDPTPTEDRVCLLTATSTELEESVWALPCEQQKLDPNFYDGKNNVLRGPPLFMRSACLFERATRFRPEKVEEANKAELSAIEALQTAHSGPLMNSQRDVAAFFEGLLHCSQLESLPKFDPEHPDPELAERRCYHRSQAKASFARVDLATFSLRYRDATSKPGQPGSDAGAAGGPAPSTSRTTTLVEKMVGCQSSLLLHSEPACSGLQTLSDDQLDQVAGTVMGEITPKYFDAFDNAEANGNAAPPFTRILVEKISEVRGASEGSAEAFKVLHNRNDVLKSAHQALTPALSHEGEGTLPVLVNALNIVYGKAVQAVVEYKDFAGRFVSALFTDKSGNRLNEEVDRSLATAVETIDQLQATRKQMRALRDDLVNLSGAAEQADRESTRRGCELLFCELYRVPRPRLCSACLSPDPDHPPSQIEKNNPLCNKDPAYQFVLDATATDICKQAGFDPATACGGRPPAFEPGPGIGCEVTTANLINTSRERAHD